MRSITMVTGLSLLALSTAGYAAPRNKTANQIPPQFWGTWYEDNADGRSFCDAYKKEILTIHKDEFPLALDTSSVVSPKLIHDVASYGEGNFYHIKTVKNSGRNRIEVTSTVTYDGSEDFEGRAAMTLQQMPGNKLKITKVFDKIESESSLYFRCGPIPKFYANRIHSELD